MIKESKSEVEERRWFMVVEGGSGGYLEKIQQQGEDREI